MKALRTKATTRKLITDLKPTNTYVWPHSKTETPRLTNLDGNKYRLEFEGTNYQAIMNADGAEHVLWTYRKGFYKARCESPLTAAAA